MTRIVLIHATPIAIDPIQTAFAGGWPEAELVNVLDDSLSKDRMVTPDLTPEMTQRITDLAVYADGLSAAGILFTCSAFGRAIEEVQDLLGIPVLKPNEAMFDAALDFGPRTAMLATFGPAVSGMEEEFAEQAAARGIEATIKSAVADGAMAALRDGDAETHNDKVADLVTAIANVDSIMLAHFSTSRALEKVRARTTLPVLTSPDAAVSKMRSMVTGEQRRQA